MKKIFALWLCVLLLCGFGPAAEAAYEASTDYMLCMMEAAVSGDVAAGLAAQHSRDAKIEAEGLSYASVDFEELLLLAKIIYAEAGSEWLSDEWKMAVGEVALNRVASPEFPDTLREVIHQPGQYYSESNRYFKNLKPSLRCVQLALRLLEGERVLHEPSVVFQANFVLGSGVHLKLVDSQLGATYLCYSSKPELYNN